MEIMVWLAANLGKLILAVEGVLASLIILFALIPGDEPEKTLQKIVDVIKSFSRK
jgi:hypothetical protein